jgi:hypothetical protein
MLCIGFSTVSELTTLRCSRYVFAERGLDMTTETNWTRDLDLDLGLIEIRDCADEHWTLRALAGASVGVDPEDAFSAAAELAEAVNSLMAGLDMAKVALATILGGRGNDYQRCLWYALAGRDPLGTAVDLGRLVEVLDARRALACKAAATGTGVAVARDPYVTDVADGPLGVFSPQFTLGPQWQPFAVSR